MQHRGIEPAQKKEVLMRGLLLGYLRDEFTESFVDDQLIQIGVNPDDFWSLELCEAYSIVEQKPSNLRLIISALAPTPLPEG